MWLYTYRPKGYWALVWGHAVISSSGKTSAQVRCHHLARCHPVEWSGVLCMQPGRCLLSREGRFQAGIHYWSRLKMWAAEFLDPTCNPNTIFLRRVWVDLDLKIATVVQPHRPPHTRDFYRVTWRKKALIMMRLMMGRKVSTNDRPRMGKCEKWL